MKFTVLGAAGRMGSMHARHLIEMGHTVRCYDLEPLPGDLQPFRIRGEQWEGSDGVVIATPAHLHAQDLAWSVENGLHVFVEKPICLIGQVARVRTVLSEAMEKNLTIDTGYNLRFHPHVIEAKQRIDTGKFLVMWGGFLMRQKPKRPLAHFLEEWASHEIDLAMHLMGPMRDFKALHRRWSTDQPSVQLMLHHQTGAVSIIHADGFKEPPVRKFTLVNEIGDTFTADIETDHVQPEHYKAELREWVNQIVGIHKCYNDSSSWLATGHDGLAVIDLLERLTK